MDLSYDRARIAGQARRGAEALFESSQRASELQLFQLSSQLLDLALQVDELARELLELPARSTEGEHRQRLPF